MMKKTWVLVANASLAKLFHYYELSHNKQKMLNPVRVFENPEGRLHNRELETDKPGSATNSPYIARGLRAMTKEVSAHEHAVAQFVKELCNFLDKSRSLNEFQRLILIAEPKLLGLLRSTLPESTRSLVAVGHNKDFIKETEKDLIQFLTQKEREEKQLEKQRQEQSTRELR